MPEQVSNDLIYSVLQKMQSDLSDVKQDIRDLKVRTGLLEGHMSSLVAAQHHTNERLDRLNDRVERIERRLDLVEVR